MNPRGCILLAILCGVFPITASQADDAVTQGGFLASPRPEPYLQMPSEASGPIPRLLSQTGAFKNVGRLEPADGLVPYDLIVPFWSDGAEKTRWIALPAGRQIHFTAQGEWSFPPGTVFVKTFSMATDPDHRQSLRRLETRLLVCQADGGVYGVTYKWRADGSEADLLATNLTEPMPASSPGSGDAPLWYYPSRADCLTCHTARAGFVLGVKTRQLNRDEHYPSGLTTNQLLAWSRAGMFDTNLPDEAPKFLPRLAATADVSLPLEDRARSYLDANCANCHRPGGTVAYFDARYDTPLPEQNLLEGKVLIDERIDGSRVIAPHDPWRSILLMRANTVEAFKMPPLARNTIDARGMELLRQWIESLPGPNVLPPPGISPEGGSYSRPVDVSLQDEPGSVIHYTLDGTVPTSSDFLYDKPIHLNSPTIVRAVAFKPGSTKSITAQAIFLISGG